MKPDDEELEEWEQRYADPWGMTHREVKGCAIAMWLLVLVGAAFVIWAGFTKRL